MSNKQTLVSFSLILLIQVIYHVIMYVNQFKIDLKIIIVAQNKCLCNLFLQKIGFLEYL